MQRFTAIAIWLFVLLQCSVQGWALPASSTDRRLNEVSEGEGEYTIQSRGPSEEAEQPHHSTKAPPFNPSSGAGQTESEEETASASDPEFVWPEMRLVPRNNRTWDDVILELRRRDFSALEICENLKSFDQRIIQDTDCQVLDDFLGVRFEEGFGDFANDKEIMREVALLTETLPMCRDGFLLDGKYCRRLIVFKRAKKRSG